MASMVETGFGTEARRGRNWLGLGLRLVRRLLYRARLQAATRNALMDPHIRAEVKAMLRPD
jgi:hypothetical protein